MEQPIFIIGCDRSGNTLLRVMLNQSSVLHIPKESGFITKLWKQQELYGDFTQPYQRWFFIRDLQTYKATSQTFSFPIFELTLEEAEEALAKIAPTNYPGATTALFKAAAHKKGKQRWGDKTPAYVLQLNCLAEAFPHAKFVHIIRDGRDVSASIIKAGWLNSFIKTAEYWHKRVKTAMEAGVTLGNSRYYELRYEQLVLYPEQTLKDLCTWLDLEYTPMMLEHQRNASNYVSNWQGHNMVKKPIDSSRVYAWKTQLSQRQLADFESVAGELLKELGYEFVGVKVPFWLKGIRFIAQNLKSQLSNTPAILRKLGVN
jgi:hypothetical protein